VRERIVASSISGNAHALVRLDQRPARKTLLKMMKLGQRIAKVIGE